MVRLPGWSAGGSGDSAVSAIEPREFLAVYVRPALEHYGLHRLEKHLAVNAISQMDNLAEVVVLYRLPEGRTELKRGEAGGYRKELRARWPVLGTVNDAHDCHKHGKLTRQSAGEDPKGVAAGRPEPMTEFGFFVDHTPVGGPLTPYEVLAVTLNDGTRREVFELLFDALQAWEQEFRTLGLDWPPA